MKTDNAMAARSTSKLVPALVLLVAILPVAASVTLYLIDWRQSSTVNHGELFKPARALVDNSMHDLEGKAVHFGDLHGQWAMVYFGSSSCPEACMQNLFRMRQIHIAQGRESERVERVFITTDAASAGLEAKLADYAGMHIWTADADALSKIADNFGTDPQQLAQQHSIYLVDPMGNLIMRYAPDTDPAGMRKDMERLLKYSGAG